MTQNEKRRRLLSTLTTKRHTYNDAYRNYFNATFDKTWCAVLPILDLLASQRLILIICPVMVDGFVLFRVTSGAGLYSTH